MPNNTQSAAPVLPDAAQPLAIGTQALFTYPDFGAPNGYPLYTAHSGQRVTLIREEEPNEETGERMFIVRATDGWEGEVWETELAAWPSEDAPNV